MTWLSINLLLGSGVMATMSRQKTVYHPAGQKKMVWYASGPVDVFQIMLAWRWWRAPNHHVIDIGFLSPANRYTN